MYYPIHMKIPEEYQEIYESLPVCIEPFPDIDEFNELTIFDEAGNKLQNAIDVIKDNAARVYRWIIKAINYMKTVIINFFQIKRAERMLKKYEKAISNYNWNIQFDNIPISGDDYGGMFESGEPTTVNDSIKEFTEFIVKNKKMIIKVSCKMFPGVKAVNIAVTVAKTLALLVPISIDFINTGKEIAMLQKKYEGKMRKIKDPDGTIKMEIPAEQWILVDKYRQLANRILDILIAPNGKQELTIEVASTQDLINFGKNFLPQMEDAIFNDDAKFNAKLNELQEIKFNELEIAYTDKANGVINDTELVNKVKSINAKFDSAVKKAKCSNVFEWTQYLVSLVIESIWQVINIYDPSNGVQYVVNGKILYNETMGILTGITKPFVEIVQEIEEIQRRGELCLDSANLIIDRCLPHAKQTAGSFVKNINDLEKNREEIRKKILVKKESVDDINNVIDQYFFEAVFSNGKETVKPLLKTIENIKEELDKQIKEQEETSKINIKDKNSKVKEFDPKAFWKNTMFKDLEDQLRKIFGFRNVEIHPYIERYITTQKQFESREFNCSIYHVDRFPVEGLVTEKGFYDKSHSTVMEIYMSLGLLKGLTAEEVLAVLLHEFGHSIDPALININFTGVNILSKYITDRKGAINKSEERALKKFGFFEVLGPIIIISTLYRLVKSLFRSIVNLFTPKDKRMENKLNKIKSVIDNDKEKFNRQNYTEAFADNFARMYGYGPALASAFKKMNSRYDNYIKSRFKKEEERQRAICNITLSMLNDSHKTDIHRIRSLIQEYKKDINDPNTPKVVKKQLEEDLLELEKVLDQYLNHKDEFQKRVNNLINEELKKLEDEDDKKESEKKDKKDDKEDKEMKESVIFFTESKKSHDKLKEYESRITNEDRAQIKEKFGDDLGCSFAKDDKGYFCFTHRCRSKSYPSIKDIPKKKYDFVVSTG